MRRVSPCWLLLATASGLISCRQSASRVDTAQATAARAGVAAALQRYQQASRTLNVADMSAAFTPAGVLFEPGIRPIVSRDSIRAFLASFPGAQVHTATATPDTIDVFGDRAYLWGSYFEHLSFPGQPTSQQHGKFVAEWARQPDGAWLIARLYRIPLPPPPASPTPVQRP